MSDKETSKTNESRRDFMKKAAYTAPVILTMSAMPTMQAIGSIQNGGSGTTPGGGLPDESGPS